LDSLQTVQRSIGIPVHMVAIALVAWLSVWAICKRPAWFHGLLIPAFFVLPIELDLWAKSRAANSLDFTSNPFYRQSMDRCILPPATENIFHSLFNLSDIRYGTVQLERSFLSN
jgi:hypothetical protein